MRRSLLEISFMQHSQFQWGIYLINNLICYKYIFDFHLISQNLHGLHT